MTPGAMARSRFGSAPTPSGNRLATITKKSSAVATSLRRRSARSRSRYTMQRAAASMSVEVDHLRGCDPRVLMRGENESAASRRMILDESHENRNAFGIQRRERLVEQPQRPRFAERQPRQRGAPALALRKASYRLLFCGESEPGERLAHPFFVRRYTCERAPDRKILGRGEIVLHRRRVPQIDEPGRIFLAQIQNWSAVPT